MLKSSTWEIEPHWQNSDFANEVSSLGKAFEEFSDRVTLGNQSRVFRYTLNGDIFYIKQYLKSTGIAAWLGYTRCQVEVRNIRWFTSLGINCGHLVAHGTEKRFFRTRRGVLVTANVENSKDLQQTFEQVPELYNSRSWRKIIIDQVADVTRKLHQKKFCHNDFQWRNILVTQNKNRPEISLIDCPFGRKYSWPLLNYRKIKDLGSLDEQARNHLSRSERLRFFKKYKNIDRLDENHKRMIRTMLSRYSD